jgi:hypothetical protein
VLHTPRERLLSHGRTLGAQQDLYCLNEAIDNGPCSCPHLEKLRAFGTDWDVDLDGRRNYSRAGGGCFPRDSPLDLVQLGCGGDLGYGKSSCAITL